MTRSARADAARSEEFSRRHIGPSDADIDAMLEVAGARSLAALCDEIVPASIRQSATARSEEHTSELQSPI